MTQIHDAAACTLLTGAKSSIGATALQLTTNAQHLYNGVEVKASPANSTGIIYVGITGVTANAADATSGFYLSAGERVFLPIEDASKVYVIGSTTGLAVFFVGS